VSLFQLMRELESFVSVRAKEKGLKFEINYTYPVPKQIVCDPTRLKQILLNLCSNAIKFTHCGGININVEYLPDTKKLRFIVADTGIGMQQDEIDKIFQPFTQADCSTTRKYGGTGLGLFISRQLAHALGGNLTCNSEKNVGSKFELTIDSGTEPEALMVTEIERDNFIITQEIKVVEPGSLAGHVLLAEDSVDVQNLVAMYIRNTGAMVTIVDNGQQAVDKALSTGFDLILMDMQMPVMDGLEAIMWLRKAGYKKPIVALTANAMKEDRERCEAAGTDDYLVKPVDLNRLYAVLEHYLPAKEAMAQESHSLPAVAINEDPEFQELVQQFVTGLPAIIEEISDAARRNDWETVRATAHKLKGMGGSFGFPELTEVAGEIQSAVDDNSYDNIHKHLNQLNMQGEKIASTSMAVDDVS
jgi:CheY-like chemotaxis protein/HPt (histidine-containing phosphotransfer) domain-containing protein/anti-sigma regulatory factor (Ser/Thr protein kinase)